MVLTKFVDMRYKAEKEKKERTVVRVQDVVVKKSCCGLL